MNLPNLFSMLRLVGVPCFFMAFYYSQVESNQSLMWISRLIVIGIVVSDFLDGFLARTFGQITALGKFLDPLADKLFVTCAFILLSVFQKVPPWLTILVVSKDVLLSLGWALRALLYDRTEIQPTLLGKLATGLQYLMVCVIILFSLGNRILLLELITGLFTVLAMVHYFYLGMKLMAQNGQHKERWEGQTIDS